MTALQNTLNKIWPGWVVEEMLGRGSFGKVYRIVREDEMGHRFSAALKTITIPADEGEFQAAINEGMSDDTATAYFSTVAQDVSEEIVLLSHFKGNSNIVSYEDHEIRKADDGFRWEIFIRMELLTPLYEYMKTNPMSVKDVVALGIDICKALELCQKNNIIHRDIKPENIFVSDFGDYKLGDFGIARRLEKTTISMSKKGTYSYMAPEVYRGEAYDGAADIYSLGLVLYRLLNNNRGPFMAQPPAQVTYQDRDNANMRRLSGESFPPPLHADGMLGSVILKAAAYHPEDRYPDARSFREALERITFEDEWGYRDNTGTVNLFPKGHKQEKREPSYGNDSYYGKDRPYGREPSADDDPYEPGGRYAGEVSYTDDDWTDTPRRGFMQGDSTSGQAPLSNKNKKLIVIIAVTILVGMTLMMGAFIIDSLVHPGDTAGQSGKEAGSGSHGDEGKTDKTSGLLPDGPRSMTVAVDPGCVGCDFKGSSKESDGPGAKTFSGRYSKGKVGPTTGIKEYDVNLQVGKRLNEELKSRGYTTILIREDNDTLLSGKERAEMAYQKGADIYVRIFCRKQQQFEKQGAVAHVPGADNPYVADLSEESTLLGGTILNSYCNATGIANAGVKAHNTSKGINWSREPVVEIMLGCINNPDEERKLADPACWDLMSKGMADGIDEYYAKYFLKK